MKKKRLLIFLAVSQILGILGAILIGNMIGSLQGYFIGYAFGVILSLGGTVGIS